MSNDKGSSGDGKLMDHVYDGIQEFDNPMPSWWKWIYLLCVLHAVAYVIYYHGGGGGLSVHEEYDKDYAAYMAKKELRTQSEASSVSEPVLAALQADPAAVAAGKEVFLTNCQSCHTDNGRGLVGPNLTDDYQIHGTTRMDLYTTIRDGVPAKGMIPWGPILQQEQLVRVAAFVASLRGTNEPNGKASEGEKVDAFAP